MSQSDALVAGRAGRRIEQAQIQVRGNDVFGIERPDDIDAILRRGRIDADPAADDQAIGRKDATPAYVPTAKPLGAWLAAIALAPAPG